MHDIWTIPTTNMMYIRLQSYTNMVGGEHGIQTFEVVVVVLLLLLLLLFNVLCAFLIFLDNWFVQINLNVNSLNSSRDHFGSHQRNVSMTMEFEVPKRPFLRLTLSSFMVHRVLR